MRRRGVSPALPGRRRSRVRYEGLDALRAAYAERKGVMLDLGHFGHWELIAYMHAFLGCPLVGITNPIANPRLESMLARLRSGSGNQIVAKADAVRASLKALARGMGVAVMIDQDARGSGILRTVFRPAFVDDLDGRDTPRPYGRRRRRDLLVSRGGRRMAGRLRAAGVSRPFRRKGAGRLPHHRRDDRAARGAD